MAPPGNRAVVVGAGVAGLTAAAELCASGWDTVVLEREERVGGLCRSFHYGRYSFDIGPHRLHTYDPGVQDFFQEVLGPNQRRVPRRSAVHLAGRTIPWPLGPSAALRLPPSILAGALADLFRTRPADGNNFRDFIRHRYGDTLYQAFFRPYTERFTGQRCEDLSANWARTSIRRALIHRGISTGSIAAMAMSSLVPRKRLAMTYPVPGGIERFPGGIADRLTGSGGRIVTGAGVDRVESAAGRIDAVHAGGIRYRCDLVIWTAPLPALCTLLGDDPQDLRFLGLVLYNLQVRGKPRTRQQWCYYSAPAIPFSRVSLPTLFGPEAAPAGMHGLCVEIPTPEDDPRWVDPEALQDQVLAGLQRVALIRSPVDITGMAIERIPEAYPLYTAGFRDRVAAARRATERFSNLHLLGRSATFWFNNIDGSVAAARALAGRLGAP